MSKVCDVRYTYNVETPCTKEVPYDNEILAYSMGAYDTSRGVSRYNRMRAVYVHSVSNVFYFQLK